MTRIVVDAIGRALLYRYATRPGDPMLIVALVDRHLELGYTDEEVGRLHLFLAGQSTVWRTHYATWPRRKRQRWLKRLRQNLVTIFGDFTDG